VTVTLAAIEAATTLLLLQAPLYSAFGVSDSTAKPKGPMFVGRWV